MRTWLIFIYVTLILALLLPSCASEEIAGVSDASPAYSRLVLSVALPGQQDGSGRTRGDFDNFDNEDDKWGKQGENIEQLRVIILDSRGSVEVNTLYSGLADAVSAGQYEYLVLNHDTKTVILLANEAGYSVETDGGRMPATDYFGSFNVNSRMDVNELQRLRVRMDANADASDPHGETMRRPLPITAVYQEHISTNEENEVVERQYDMHRAAVKYSFRIINKSKFDHKLEGIRISRVTDEEFLFPNAEYETNTLGHQVIRSYSTPSTASESEYSYSGFSLFLPKHMEQAVQAIEPVYVPEGVAGGDPYKVSITLNSAPLAIWGELKWRMPGQDIQLSTPMTDLPRNTHVVVNITIKDDNTYEFTADVQPYSSVQLDPFFGLERDKNGNIIVEHHPDGTFDVIENGEIVRKDSDGDDVIGWFTDGSLYCCEKVLKDYLHDNTEVDYIYYFEKDYAGGNMIIIREKSAGGTYHQDDLPTHDHGMDDRAMFVLTKEGDFKYVRYTGSTAVYSDRDMNGDKIIQANGYQFRNEGDMHKYIGSYVVELPDGTEELRYYKDGSTLDWETGVPDSYSTRSSATVTPARRKEILRRMRRANANPFTGIR